MKVALDSPFPMDARRRNQFPDFVVYNRLITIECLHEGSYQLLPASVEDAAPFSTKQELARRLGVSQRWIEYRMNDGLPHWKLGRAVRFCHADVLAWIATEQEAAR